MKDIYDINSRKRGNEDDGENDRVKRLRSGEIFVEYLMLPRESENARG